MKYLVYYFDKIHNSYQYRFCGEMENAFRLTERLLNDGICSICYVYTLYGRRGTLRYEEKK